MTWSPFRRYKEKRFLNQLIVGLAENGIGAAQQLNPEKGGYYELYNTESPEMSKMGCITIYDSPERHPAMRVMILVPEAKTYIEKIIPVLNSLEASFKKPGETLGHDYFSVLTSGHVFCLSPTN